MKKYEGLVVLENNELAESVYAASGAVLPSPEIDYDNDAECWTVSVTRDQVVAGDGYTNFRIQANHPGTVTHISSSSRVVIVFNIPVTAAKCEGFTIDVSGSTVTVTRASHGNSYYSADQYNSLLNVYSADPEGLSVTSATIYCTHAVNVQGGFD